MIFLWVIWFWILITIIIDIFRSHDLPGCGQGPVVRVHLRALRARTARGTGSSR